MPIYDIKIREYNEDGFKTVDVKTSTQESAIALAQVWAEVVSVKKVVVNCGNDRIWASDGIYEPSSAEIRQLLSILRPTC